MGEGGKLKQRLNWRNMVKWIRSPLEHRLSSGACVLLHTVSPNLQYRNTSMDRNKSEAGLTDDSIFFNRESNCREIKNTFSLSFSALNNESISISASYKARLHLLELYLERMWPLSVTGPAFAMKKLIGKQNIEEDVLPESTSSSSKATSTLCFVNFPTTAASYLSY